jgi:hypothetical protein
MRGVASLQREKVQEVWEKEEGQGNSGEDADGRLLWRRHRHPERRDRVF